MADSGEETMASSWFGGWLQTAKEKSAAALDLVRKDLVEFGCTMQNDAGQAVQFTSTTLQESLKTFLLKLSVKKEHDYTLKSMVSLAVMENPPKVELSAATLWAQKQLCNQAENTSAAKEKLTKGLNTFLEGISKALVVPPDDEGQIPITASSAELYDRTKARLHAIQVDPRTYLDEPSGSSEMYGMWCEGFDLDDVKGEISELLVSKSEVRGLYTKLVPSQVSHVDFWRHYFYKLHQLDVDQARKEALMKRAETTRADSLSWEDDWSGDEGAEDSGSDWEKLPRPNHQKSPSASPTPALSTRQDTASSQQRMEHKVQASGQVEAEAQSCTGRQCQEINLNETEQREESLVSPLSQVLSPVNCSTGVDQPVSAGSWAEEAAGSPAAPSPVQESTGSSTVKETPETFKEHLNLAPGDLGDVVEVAQPGSSGPVPSVAQLAAPEEVPGGDGEALPADPETQGPLTSTVCEAASGSGHPVTASSLTEEQSGNDAHVEATSPPPVESASQPGTLSGKTDSTAGQQGAVGSTACEELSVAVGSEYSTLKTTERGDLVLVGSDHGSPLSNTSGSKGVSDVDDDWEQDLDIELTEEDMKAAEELAKKLGDNINLEDDDWESWE